MVLNKHMIAAVLMCTSSWAMAINPAALLGNTGVQATHLDNLKAEQQNYQLLIKEHARENVRAERLQSRLLRAEKKLEKAQFKVNKLRAELMITRDIQQRQVNELKVAGERLNRAWQAAYGAPNYRVAQKK